MEFQLLKKTKVRKLERKGFEGLTLTEIEIVFDEIPNEDNSDKRDRETGNSDHLGN